MTWPKKWQSEGSSYTHPFLWAVLTHYKKRIIGLRVLVFGIKKEYRRTGINTLGVRFVRQRIESFEVDYLEEVVLRLSKRELNTWGEF